MAYFDAAYFDSNYFDTGGSVGIDSLFVRFSQEQDDTLLRKWGQTAVSGMSDNELKWCMANEVSASSTEAEAKWAHKIV